MIRDSNHYIILRVVNFVGAAALLYALGVIVPPIFGHDVPPAIYGIAGTVVGYLGGLLSSARTKPDLNGRTTTVTSPDSTTTVDAGDTTVTVDGKP